MLFFFDIGEKVKKNWWMFSFVRVINRVKICGQFVENLEGLLEMFIILFVVQMISNNFFGEKYIGDWLFGLVKVIIVLCKQGMFVEDF